MTEPIIPEQPTSPKDPTLKKDMLKSDDVRSDTVLSEKTKGTKDALSGVLDAVLEGKNQRLQELSLRRAANQLSPKDFDLNYIVALNNADLPMTRKDLEHETGLQALVLTYEDCATVRFLDFIRASGERIIVELERMSPDDVFVLFPYEVGNLSAEVTSENRTEAQNPNDPAEAIRAMQRIFAGVPPREQLSRELPEFWNGIDVKAKEMPSGVVIDGRKNGVPEVHLRGFARDIIEGEIQKGDFAWIARFLKNMKFGTEEEIAFFEQLAGKKTV